MGVGDPKESIHEEERWVGKWQAGRCFSSDGGVFIVIETDDREEKWLHRLLAQETVLVAEHLSRAACGWECHVRKLCTRSCICWQWREHVCPCFDREWKLGIVEYRCTLKWYQWRGHTCFDVKEKLIIFQYSIHVKSDSKVDACTCFE